MSTVTRYTDADIDRLMKRRYKALANNVYAAYDAILSQLPKETGGFGQSLQETFQVSLGGSVGSSTDGTLPLSNDVATLQAEYSPARLYGRAVIDNLAIENARSSEDAIVKLLDFKVNQTVLSFNRNRARIFFNDKTGVLGQFTAQATGTAALPTVVILNTGQYKIRKFHFEPRDYVNIGVAGLTSAAPCNPPFAAPANTSLFEVLSFNATTGALALSRISGTADLTDNGTFPTTNHYNVYMQGSQNADCTGLFDILFGTSVYGVTKQNRWTPHVIPGTSDSNLNGAEVTLDVLTTLYDLYNSETEQNFTHIITSPLQLRKIKRLMEGQKRYPVETESKALSSKGFGNEKLLAKVGFSAVKFFGNESSTVIQQHRLLRDDMIVFINRPHIRQRHIVAPQWAERDGTTWLRKDGVDQYEARYLTYAENLINPYHIGFIQGLSTTE